LEAILKSEISRCNRMKQKLALLLLDIDNFKQINDTRGHAVGDEVLCRIATGIVTRLRAVDQVARWGGEEFCCLLPLTDLRGGAAIAERLREGIAGLVLNSNDSQPLQLTVSIGITELNTRDTISSLLRRADDALYQAKGAGKNRVCLGTADISEGLETALGHA
jgi:diguanylate cyclase (GGDEF)-like protein